MMIMMIMIVTMTLYSRGETSALNRKEIIESVKESLLNLNLGYIDLVLVHKTDPQCPVEGGWH